MTIFTLFNSAGLTLTGSSVGASVLGLTVTNAAGVTRDVVLGLPDEAAYRNNPAYIGCVIGRVAGRTWPTHVNLEGQALALDINDQQEAHLHGGAPGWHTGDWEILEQGPDAVLLGRISPDGEGGYPGTVAAQVRYQVTADNRWIVTFSAVTDRLTPISMTQHAYFNLAGHDAGSVERHTLTLPQVHLLPLDHRNVAYGRELDVTGTPFDFCQAAAIGPRFGHMGGDPPGLDHCFRIGGQPGDLRFAAGVDCPGAPMRLEVFTTQAALQLYAGLKLDGSVMGKHGAGYCAYAGLCLETQAPPNLLNQPALGSNLLRPGERYSQTTEYRFLERR